MRGWEVEIAQHAGWLVAVDLWEFIGRPYSTDHVVTHIVPLTLGSDVSADILDVWYNVVAHFEEMYKDYADHIHSSLNFIYLSRCDISKKT